jgi:hypothetical protein
MTQNRAHKLAARAAAASADVRRPEAIYGTDHRALFVERGVYNFAAGPLRYAGGYREVVAEEAQDVIREAESKGWRVITAESLPKAGIDLDDLKAGPMLLVLNVDSKEAFDSLDPLTKDLIDGKHPDVNVLVAFHFDGEVLTGAAKRRGKTIRIIPPFEVPTAREWAMIRIAFARRYADMLESGADQVEALISVARAVERLGAAIHAGSLMAQALRQAAADMQISGSAETVWAPHQEVLGGHLFPMLLRAPSAGSTSRLLRQAAETLEADMRIGLA